MDNATANSKDTTNSRALTTGKLIQRYGIGFKARVIQVDVTPDSYGAGPCTVIVRTDDGKSQLIPFRWGERQLARNLAWKIAAHFELEVLVPGIYGTTIQWYTKTSK